MNISSIYIPRRMRVLKEKLPIKALMFFLMMLLRLKMHGSVVTFTGHLQEEMEMCFVFFLCVCPWKLNICAFFFFHIYKPTGKNHKFVKFTPMWLTKKKKKKKLPQKLNTRVWIFWAFARELKGCGQMLNDNCRNPSWIPKQLVAAFPSTAAWAATYLNSQLSLLTRYITDTS